MAISPDQLRRSGRELPALGEHRVEHAVADVGHEVGELLEAHLDALPEVVGDDHALLRCGRVVEVELGAAAVALAAEGGDVAHGLLRAGQDSTNPNGNSRRWRWSNSASPSRSRVGPSATTAPSSSTMLRGQSCNANGRSWVTISVVASSRSNTSASSRRATGSRLDDGSSSTSIS